MSFSVCIYTQPYIDIEIKLYKNGLILYTYNSVNFFVVVIFISNS